MTIVPFCVITYILDSPHIFPANAMDWRFERVMAPEYIRIVTSGVYCSTGFEEMFDNLTSLEYWRFGTPLLLDHRKLDLISTDPIELMAGSDNFVSRKPDFAFCRIAILFETTESLEIAERYGEITDDRSLAEVQRFLKESDAIEWLVSY